MATHSVNVVVKGHDKASKQFGHIGKSATGMGAAFRGAAMSAAALFSVVAIKRWMTSALKAYGKQEMAVRNLTDALRILGKAGEIEEMKKFASELQKITTYGDEAILEMMALGSALGKLSGEQLKEATRAAIGLSKMGIELTASMRLIARAAIGDTSTLSRYGIKLDMSKSIQERFNEVLKIGAGLFSIAEGETKAFAGQLKQAENRLGDINEVIGETVAQALPQFVKWIKDIRMETVKTVVQWTKWTVGIGGVLYLTPKLIRVIGGIAKAVQLLTKSTVIMHAFAGPKGWAMLAASIAVAATTVAVLDSKFGGLNKSLDDTRDVAAAVGAETSGTTGEIQKMVATINSISAAPIERLTRSMRSLHGEADSKKAAWAEIRAIIADIAELRTTEWSRLESQLRRAGFMPGFIFGTVKELFRARRLLRKEKEQPFETPQTQGYRGGLPAKPMRFQSFFPGGRVEACLQSMDKNTKALLELQKQALRRNRTDQILPAGFR